MCTRPIQSPHFTDQDPEPQAEKWRIQGHTAMQEQGLSSLLVQRFPPYDFETFEAYLKTACVLSPYSPYAEFLLQAGSSPPETTVFAAIFSSVPKLLILSQGLKIIPNNF